MDRFIVGDYKATYRARKHFKIQYGQIYRSDQESMAADVQSFKIQYGQIYSAYLPEYKKDKFQFKIQYGQIYSAELNADVFPVAFI